MIGRLPRRERFPLLPYRMEAMPTEAPSQATVLRNTGVDFTRLHKFLDRLKRFIRHWAGVYLTRRHGSY